MRTASTIAKKHTGEWVILANPDKSIIEQNENFKKLLGTRAHKDFAFVRYQESDGIVRDLKFRTPEEHEEHEARRADELKAHEEHMKKLNEKKLEKPEPKKK
jgi:hypothetical protein